MKVPQILVLIAAMWVCQTLTAGIIHYDGSAVPASWDGNGSPPQLFCGSAQLPPPSPLCAGMSSDGNVLSINTTDVFDDASGFVGTRSLGSDIQGDYMDAMVQFNASLPPGGEARTFITLTDERSIEQVQLTIFSDGRKFLSLDNRGPDCCAFFTTVLDVSGFHFYQEWLKGGNMTLAVDGAVLYSGSAEGISSCCAGSFGDIAIFNSGTATMQVDSADFYSGDDFASAPSIPGALPEPRSWTFALTAVFSMLGARLVKRKS